MPAEPGARGTLALGAGLALLGVAMVVKALDAGDGPLSAGVLLGAAFVVAGAARAWTAGRDR